MLVEFTVGNYRSFRERQTFSMEATSLKSAPPQRHLDESNVVQAEPKLQLLTSAALYGANASGKSNLVKAIEFMRDFVLNSSRDRRKGQPTGVESFLLSVETAHTSSHFEIVFTVKEQRFRYGFEANAQLIRSEWFYRVGVRGEILLFERNEQTIHVNTRNFREGRDLEERTRENALFLSVAAQFNGQISTAVINWLSQFVIISGLDDSDYKTLTDQFMTEPEHRALVLRFVRQLDLNIVNFTVEVEEPAFLHYTDETGIMHPVVLSYGARLVRPNSTAPDFRYKMVHSKLDTQGNLLSYINFDLESQESDGTRKLIYLSGAILNALNNGYPVLIDELDARLHPQMTCAIVQLFNDKESNPNGAQLIFTTHDTNLLSNKLFRRDQIWFAEKDDKGGTNLYSLAEYQLEDGGTARNDANLEADYIRGKFGAIPFLGDLRRVVADVVAHDGDSKNGNTPRENVTDTEAEHAA